MNQQEKHTLSLAGFLITLVGAIMFSTKAIIVKLAFKDTHTDALTMLTLRMLFSLPFYIGAAYFSTSRESNVMMNRKEWLNVIGLGVLGYYLSSLLDFIGLQYISAGLERLILFLYPTFAVLINSFLFKQQLTKYQKIALLLTYAGIAIAYFGEMKIDTSNPDFYFGSLMVFLCAVTFSMYLVGSGRVIPKVGATKFTAYAMLASTGGILIHFLVAGDYSKLNTGRGLWWYGLLIAVVATVIPSFMMSAGMKKIGANNVAIISAIGPVSTILQAHFILGESIFAEQIVGTLMVISGVLLIGWKRLRDTSVY